GAGAGLLKFTHLDDDITLLQTSLLAWLARIDAGYLGLGCGQGQAGLGHEVDSIRLDGGRYELQRTFALQAIGGFYRQLSLSATTDGIHQLPTGFTPGLHFLPVDGNDAIIAHDASLSGQRARRRRRQDG